MELWEFWIWNSKNELAFEYQIQNSKVKQNIQFQNCVDVLESGKQVCFKQNICFLVGYHAQKSYLCEKKMATNKKK